MACVGAYECEICGGLKFTAEGSTDPVFKHFPHYTKPHVCSTKAIAEKRYLADPAISLDDPVPELRGWTYADVIL